MDLKLLKMLCKDSKQHHVIFRELYSVSSLLCIVQNVRFEIPYKVFYFKTPFLITFKYYAWVSCDVLLIALAFIGYSTAIWLGKFTYFLLFCILFAVDVFHHFFRSYNLNFLELCDASRCSNRQTCWTIRLQDVSSVETPRYNAAYTYSLFKRLLGL